jgi:hypothetical protein|tara:strand:+ start:5995 stop:6672 length:678 start_codon:yes stop_codon:yes gene_type:complete
MGYLDKTTITVDAILTKKGRELLAKGSEFFNITQFALADDEIDYGLWDVNHQLGTNYYGQAIEAMPLVEAVPNENYVMKHKLVTLPKNISRMPTVTVGVTDITLTYGGDKAPITPNTANFANGNKTYGYTAILANSDACYLNVAPGGRVSGRGAPTTADYIGDTGNSVTSVGTRFEIVAKPQPTADITTTLTLIGNETGGYVTINVTVKKEATATNLVEDYYFEK